MTTITMGSASYSALIPIMGSIILVTGVPVRAIYVSIRRHVYLAYHRRASITLLLT